MAKSKASKQRDGERRLFGPRYNRRKAAQLRIMQEFDAAQKSHDPARFLSAVEAVDAEPMCRAVTRRWLRNEHRTNLGALRAELWQRMLYGTARRVYAEIAEYEATLPGEADARA